MTSSGQSSPWRRVLARLLVAAALAVVALVLGATPASAHASLLGTDPSEGQVLPTAPSRATFTFDEPVRSVDGGVRVFDASGEELTASSKTTDARLVVDLPDGLVDGTYVIAWRVISSDGHPVAGALTFSVGTPSAEVAASVSAPRESPTSVKALLGVFQAATYLGIFGAAGLVVFLLLVLRQETGLDQVRDRLAGLARAAAWTAVVAGFVVVVLTALYQRGDDLAALFSDGPYDVPADSGLLSWSLAGLGVLVAAYGVRARSAPAAVPLGGAALALVSLTLVGHTRAFPPLWLMITSDLAHVAAGSIWFGGLVGLVFSLRRLADRPRVAAVVLGRFSLVAAWLLTLVAFTGSVLGWRILKSWDNFFHTDFGQVLLVKIVVVSLVAVTAGWNRYRLMPAVLADSGHGDRGAASLRMQRTVRLEAVLLVVVLGLTGFLVDRTPVPSTAAVALPGALDSSTFSGVNGEVKVVVTVDPIAVGRNTVLFQVQDTAGNPLEPAEVPTLNATEGDLAIGDQAVTNVDSGTYAASIILPKAGTWELQVSIRLSEFENPVVTVRLPIPAGP